jgi:hypothetical protein
VAYSFQLHPDVETLLKSAVGTSLSLGLVDDAAAIGYTRIYLFVLHRSFEEALAALTSE